MRVYCTKSGRDAAWRVDRDIGEEGFFATPPGTSKHSKVNAKRFSSLVDLGHFLVRNPDSEVYVGDAQINTHVAVEGTISLGKLRDL
jgi:hypothetical protein